MWLFQGVLNAGLQILLSIFGGWLCARLKLVDPEILSRQLNAFAMRAAFPAFIIHLLGIKTNLQDLQAWRALGVFILWVFLIHMACILWHKLRGGKSTVQLLGINCLLLTTNNTGCIGWPVLIATVGRQGAALSMLLGVLFFVQLLPAAITCFEYHKFFLEHQEEDVRAVAVPALDTMQATDQELLPTTMASADADKPLTECPPEFRYCYWSNADYVPTSTPFASSKQLIPVASDKACPNYVEVHVDHASEDADCSRQYGAGVGSSGEGSSASAAVTQQAWSTDNSSNGSSSSGDAAKDWWRAGATKQPAALKRAKDSCDSLYTPFAGAALNTKHEDMQQRPQIVQSPRPVQQLANLTRRLSRGVTQQTAAAAAVASNAVAAAASPVRLVRAASLKRQQQAQQLRGSSAVPLLAEHDGPVSCGGTTSPALASSRRTSNNCAPALASTSEESIPASNTEGQQRQGLAVFGRSRTAGMGEVAQAADSAVELHTMWQDGSKSQQQQQQDVDSEQHGSNRNLSTVSAPIAAAAGGAGGFVCNNSFVNGVRSSSKTALLLPAAGGVAGRKSTLKRQLSRAAHGASTAAGAAGASCAGGLEKHEELPHQSCFGSFVSHHPLLWHITTVQLKSFHLWLNVVAIALSVSGARKYLDADSAAYIPALGWLDGVLGWFSSACIPVLLFSNGVWMVNKDVFGGKKGQLQVTLLLFFKLAVLPAFMVGLTQLFGMRDEYGLSLVLLASCPLAPLAFLVCQQYGVGAELATSVTIQGVLLMLPQMMAIIKISQVSGLYDVDMLKGA